MGDPRTRGWVEIHAEECKGCALCIAVCPAGCLGLAEELNHQGYHPVAYSGDGCRADGWEEGTASSTTCLSASDRSELNAALGQAPE